MAPEGVLNVGRYIMTENETIYVVLDTEDSYVVCNAVKAFKNEKKAKKFVHEEGGCPNSADCMYYEPVELEE
jgi:hypothetical protein